MKDTNQKTISMMVAKKTGFSKEVVEFVIKDLYRQIKGILTSRSHKTIVLSNFLKFSDYEKRKNNS